MAKNWLTEVAKRKHLKGVLKWRTAIKRVKAVTKTPENQDNAKTQKSCRCGDRAADCRMPKKKNCV